MTIESQTIPQAIAEAQINEEAVAVIDQEQPKQAIENPPVTTLDAGFTPPDIFERNYLLARYGMVLP